MLLLAMSCFQGRTQDAALDGLLAHAPAGVQLTPGNLPSSGFRARVAAFHGTVRVHHRFAWDRYRTAVYDAAGRPLLCERERSVHPPEALPECNPLDARAWIAHAVVADLLVETMYPGCLLGTGAELDLAMDHGLRLAVDVSHLHLQRCAGVLPDRTLRRLLAYRHVEEVHVSRNDGRRDQHAPLDSETPWLAWARERVADLPVVVESYWHRASFDNQRRQIDLLRPEGRVRSGLPVRRRTALGISVEDAGDRGDPPESMV